MQNGKASGDNSSLLAVACVIGIIAIDLWRAFGGPPQLFMGVMLAAALLIAVQYRKIPSNLRRTSLMLFAASLLVLPFAQAPLESIQRGTFVAGTLIGLMASVMLLGRCALRSAQVHVIGRILRAQPPGRRYGAFTVAGQLFSAMLGMAGANIMFAMAAPAGEPRNEQKTASIIAVTRGFTGAGLWSPMFGNMAILLAIYPSLRWIEVFPVGLASAQFIMGVGILMNHFGKRPPPDAGAEPNAGVISDGGATTPPAGTGMAAAAVPLLAAMLSFLGLVLTASIGMKISTSAAITLFGPMTAVLLNIAMAERGDRVRDGLRRLREDLHLFPNLASEAILFLAAGCAGSIMGNAFPASWVTLIGQGVGGNPLLAIAFLLFAIMITALLGIHPVLTAVFLATTISPAVLGLPPILHVCAILTGWGISAVLTPYSVLSLTASRYSGETLYQISLGRNSRFALINAVVACLLLTAIALFMRA